MSTNPVVPRKGSSVDHLRAKHADPTGVVNVTIRFEADQIVALRRLATELGMPASTTVREIVVDQLHAAGYL